MRLSAETTMGTAFGTPRYIAPEQALASNKAVPQSDIYSLAVILYEILTGETPLSGDTPMQIALSHIGDPPPRPRSKTRKFLNPSRMKSCARLRKSQNVVMEARGRSYGQLRQHMVSALRLPLYRNVLPYFRGKCQPRLIPSRHPLITHL